MIPQKGLDPEDAKKRGGGNKRFELAPLASFEDYSDEAVHAAPKEFRTPCYQRPKQQPPPPPEPIPSTSKAAKKSRQPPPNLPPIPTSSSSLSHPLGEGNPELLTPRIDISCASNSTSSNDENSSDQELLKPGLSFAFHEDGTEDLRSSTEDIGMDDDDDAKKKGTEKEPLSGRAPEVSHHRRHLSLYDHDYNKASPRRVSESNLFERRHSSVSAVRGPTPEQCIRRPSSHSLFQDAFLTNQRRHSSYSNRGEPDLMTLSITNADGRRSISPHRMMLETSFCGNSPIPSTSFDQDDVYSLSSKNTEKDICSRLEFDNSSHQSPAALEKKSNVLTISQTQTYKHSFESEEDLPTACSAKSATSSTTSKVLDDDGTGSVRCVHPPNPTDFSRSPNVIQGTTSATVYPEPPDSHVQNEEYEEADRIPRAGEILPEPDLPGSPIFSQEKITLFSEDSIADDDFELPFVPTTLPIESSAVVPIVPVKDRNHDYLLTSTPLQRPRRATQPNPSSINDYIGIIGGSTSQNATSSPKLKVNLPKEDPLQRQDSTSSTKSGTGSISSSTNPQATTTPKHSKPDNIMSWTNFAEMGLQSPRNIRRKLNSTSSNDPPPFDDTSTNTTYANFADFK